MFFTGYCLSNSIIQIIYLSLKFNCFQNKNIFIREQRSSSEDSVTKLLQYNPVSVYDSDDEDGFTISKEAFTRMNNLKAEYQSPVSEEAAHVVAQDQVGVSEIILTFKYFCVSPCCVSDRRRLTIVATLSQIILSIASEIFLRNTA